MRPAKNSLRANEVFDARGAMRVCDEYAQRYPIWLAMAICAMAICAPAIYAKAIWLAMTI
jgi:hypothetical protein